MNVLRVAKHARSLRHGLTHISLLNLETSNSLVLPHKQSTGLHEVKLQESSTNLSVSLEVYHILHRSLGAVTQQGILSTFSSRSA